MDRTAGGPVTGTPSVRTLATDRSMVIRLSGELDYVTCRSLTEQVTEVLVCSGAGSVVLDLSQVSFCDSAGLSLLLGAYRRTEERGIHLVLASPPEQLRRILRMTGVDQVLRICDTVAQAQAQAQVQFGQGSAAESG
ncbi:STAS domain-containing protein [Streptomyces sp. NPDC102406]|uniref:STAS domain-containing protein n=1 Tax=Streptomyces sp. NPDC102406 TaxID=3366171 RepID=UPI00382AC4DE